MTNPNEIDEVNYGRFTIFNFQPIPKRFMVWDKEEKKFLGEQLWDY